MLYKKKENTLTDTYSLLLSKVMTELYMVGVGGHIRALFGIKKTIFFVVHAKPDVRLRLEQATGGFLCCASLCVLPFAVIVCNRFWPDKQTTEPTHTPSYVYERIRGADRSIAHPLVSQRRSTTADWPDTVFQTSLLHELLRHNTHLATKLIKLNLASVQSNCGRSSSTTMAFLSSGGTCDLAAVQSC